MATEPDPNAPWGSPAHEAWKQKSYEDELISRYQNRLPLTNTDSKEARRLIRQRAKVSA